MPVEDPGGVITAGPDRQTRVIGGNGTQSLSATLAPGLFQYVESVLVQVANGGGDVQPELSIATSNGTVIATQRQDDAIPAGDTGAATFALRIPAKTNKGFIRYAFANVGTWLQVVTTAFNPVTNWAMRFVDQSVGGVLFDTQGDFQVDAAQAVNLHGSSFEALSNGGFWNADSGGGQMRIETGGGNFELLTAPDGNVTVRQDGLGVWNIQDAGDTFKITDSAGNPLVTYTG